MAAAGPCFCLYCVSIGSADGDLWDCGPSPRTVETSVSDSLRCPGSPSTCVQDSGRLTKGPGDGEGSRRCPVIEPRLPADHLPERSVSMQGKRYSSSSTRRVSLLSQTGQSGGRAICLKDSLFWLEDSFPTVVESCRCGTPRFAVRPAWTLMPNYGRGRPGHRLLRGQRCASRCAKRRGRASGYGAQAGTGLLVVSAAGAECPGMPALDAPQGRHVLRSECFGALCQPKRADIGAGGPPVPPARRGGVGAPGSWFRHPRGHGLQLELPLRAGGILVDTNNDDSREARWRYLRFVAAITDAGTSRAVSPVAAPGCPNTSGFPEGVVVGRRSRGPFRERSRRRKIPPATNAICWRD